MRLINVTTTRFEEFPEYGMPRYAILSHTWGRDIEELTFGEVEQGINDKPGVGSVKLKGCCEQAKRDGFGCVWIDTCCVDKTNLVELSEAINSMFRWYQHAAVCYAYLSDVHDGEDPRAEGSSFRTSRWFSRGWTLQELLAPKRLVFFSTDWHRLGTKVQLRTVVEQITGIPERFLRGSSDISSASVAQRMSWAAQRQTGRPEDIAYCLLGIFGIAMPMIYGEGRDRAFMRLQEHIMRTTSDHSILAWGLGGPTSGSEQAQPGGGILANSPSDFAHSGHIVPQDQRTAYVDQLEISGGSLRVSLSVIATSTETIGLLNCGPEEDSQQSVGIPLAKVAVGSSNEFTRSRGRRSVLLSRPRPDVARKVIYLRNDNGENAQSSGQQCWIYDDGDFADIGLEVLDVMPRFSWHEERSKIVPATNLYGGMSPTLVRLRHDSEGSVDFLVLLMFTQQGRVVDARYHITTCSRDTLPESLVGEPLLVMQEVAGRENARNGFINLALVLEQCEGRSMFAIKPERTFYTLEVTLDVTTLDAVKPDQPVPTSIQFWDRASDQPHWILTGHGHSVTSVAISHDSRLLASGSADYTIRLWSLTTGHVLQTLYSNGKIWSAAFSHDSKLLASSSSNSRIQLWNLATGELQHALDGHENGVYSVVFSHDSTLLASAGSDHTIRLWDTTAGQLHRILRGHSSVGISLAFSGDSRLLAAGSISGPVWLWDPTTGQLQQTLRGHLGRVPSLCFLYNSTILASASWDGTVRLWDVATGQERHALKEEPSVVCAAAFSHDSKLLASVSYDGTIRLWDTTTAQVRRTLNHPGRRWSAVFSPDSRILVSASSNKTIRVWKTNG